MGNALTTETSDDSDLLSFADLVTWTPTTPATPKAKSDRDFAAEARAESFEKLRAAYEAKETARVGNAILAGSIRYVGNGKTKSHVFVHTSRGLIKFSTVATRDESPEQDAIIAKAREAYPGCDLSVTAKKAWL